MALRKKLYYDVSITTGGVRVAGISTPFSPFGLRFVGSTGPNFGTTESQIGNQFAALPDRYGNVMDPTLLDGVTAATDPSGQKRTRQAIGAWFQCSFASGSPGLGTHVPIDPSIDFITETAPAIAATPAIDPATVRRPRARLKIETPVGIGQVTRGVLYIQRQHGVEV
jgi:hypothetical protein